MAEHRIAILNRIAVADAGIELVCNNPTDTIRFEFDDEWSGIVAKTARFTWEGNKIDVTFSGNVVEVPEIFRTHYVFVGVYTDNITSTPAKVKCRYSIKCLGGKNPPPSEDVYKQILALINDLQLDGVSDEQIAKAVQKYFEDNPIEGGSGGYYTPEVDKEGNLSWTASKEDMPSPATVNIKGEPGKDGVDGKDGNPGKDGSDGQPGKDGKGIKSIVMNADFTLTLTLDDGTSYTTPSIRGTDGAPGADGEDGQNGADGEDGVSPTVAVSTITGGHRVTITDKNGTKSVDVLDGSKGDKGDKGDQGIQGIQGDPGGYYEPSVDVAGNLTWTPSNDDMLHITGLNIKGPKGDPGASVTVLSITESNEDGGINTVAFTDGKILTVKNGTKGSKGDKGETGEQGPKGDTGPAGNDGYTPQRGVDYFTPSDEAEWSEYIASELAKRGQLKPEFANDISECADTSKLYVLPDGYIYAFMKTTITTEGETVPNFTNLLDDPNAYTKPDLRYSQSSASWKDNIGGTSYVIPIPKGNVTLRIKNYHWHNYQYMYAGTNNTTFGGSVGDTSTGSAFLTALSKKDELITLTFTNNDYSYATFVSKTGYVEIITANEEITYTTTPGGTETVYAWKNTGHAFVPADYEDRIVELENGLKDAKNDIRALQDKNSNAVSGNATTAFSVPAYCPTPQLPADGSEGSDFDYKSTTTQDAYDYMDALCGKYTQYITKQTMGKDASGTFDHNRYILSKAYWRAWQRENYPKMFAWTNGSTVIYSVSVSPRVGDTMYSTPYIGTAYSTVTAVNSAEHTASTRTVNGLVFTRNAEADVEPTIAYSKPPQYPGNFVGASVYNSTFGSLTTVSTVGSDYFVGANGIKYFRYPFEDRKQDKTKPLHVFVLSNEHGNYGDDLIPSFVVMRMAKDLCKNTENPFLKWMKENCLITMIPVGNPWGYARYLVNNGSGYCNSNAVNINRNYDTPGWETSNTDPQGGTKEDGAFGAYPGSEIETQHIMNTMQLCKPAVGISMHSPGFAPQYKDMPDNAYFIHQGQGYDAARVQKITETLYSNFGMGGSADVGSAQHYENCGKSPAYIQYVGAVGGLTETVTQENGTNNIYTAIAMEQAYTQMLLFLQNWCKEALSKV